MVLTKAEAAPARQSAPSSTAASRTRAQNERAETAAYLAELASTMAALARSQKFDALAYLLDLARLEAESLSGRHP
jgi:hypothetical protein